MAATDALAAYWAATSPKEEREAYARMMLSGFPDGYAPPSVVEPDTGVPFSFTIALHVESDEELMQASGDGMPLHQVIAAVGRYMALMAKPERRRMRMVVMLESMPADAGKPGKTTRSDNAFVAPCSVAAP